MAGKHDDNLVIRELEYTIRIRDNDSGFREVRDLLRSELTRFDDQRKRNPSTDNPIRDFLQLNIERSVAVRDHTQVYFTNYKEKEGSLILQFTLLLITQTGEYPSVRHVLDHLIHDTISDYFEELLDRHLPVTVNVQSDERIPSAMQSKLFAENNKTPHQRMQVLPIVLSGVAVALSLVTILLLLFHKPESSPNTNRYEDLQQKYNELLIEKKINEAIAQQTIQLTVNKAGDSLQITGEKQSSRLPLPGRQR